MTAGACREDWNAMPPVAEGRFCLKCRHAVMDFTGWDRRAVVAYKREHPEACGVYRPEHLEPHLVPLVELLSPKRGLLAAGLTLGSVAVIAQDTRTPAPSEYTRPVLPVDAPRAAQVVEAPASPEELEKEMALFGTCVRQEPLAAPRTRPHRFHRLYVSKRFPFIHFRRRRLMGRFALHTNDNLLRGARADRF